MNTTSRLELAPDGWVHLFLPKYKGSLRIGRVRHNAYYTHRKAGDVYRKGGQQIGMCADLLRDIQNIPFGKTVIEVKSRDGAITILETTRQEWLTFGRFGVEEGYEEQLFLPIERFKVIKKTRPLSLDAKSRKCKAVGDKPARPQGRKNRSNDSQLQLGF